MKERGALGIWLNRLSLLALELPFKHEIETEEDGHWRLRALEEGKLIARYANGDQRAVDLREGTPCSPRRPRSTSGSRSAARRGG